MQTELVDCPLCGAREYKKVLADYDRITGSRHPFTLVRCDKCNLLYVNPRPCRETLSLFYNEDYFAYVRDMRSDVCASEKRGTVRRFYINLRETGLYKFIWKVLYSIFTTHNDYIQSLALGENCRVLDIGCGPGMFLERLRWLSGCKVKGIENNVFARNAANRLLGKGSVVEKIAGLEGEGPFDYVLLNFVFEHLSEPSKTLDEINRLLKNNGLLIMNIPNAQSWSWKVFKRFWTSLDLPRHLMLLTPETAGKFLSKSGFETVKVKYTNCPCAYIFSLQSIFLKSKIRIRKHFSRAFIFNFVNLINLLLFPIGFIEILFRSSAGVIIYAKRVP